jgi:hypothetical protein
MVPKHYGSDNISVADTATMFVYNLMTGAWNIHKISYVTSALTVGAPVYYKNNIYFLVEDYVITTDSSNCQDDKFFTTGDAAFDVTLHSANFNLGNRYSLKRCNGVELLLNSPALGGGALSLQVASDFGRKVSAATTQTFLQNYQSLFFSAGVDGRYLQWRLTGSANSGNAAQEILSAGVTITS